ncbi:MAG: sulfotransferase domain-containing protein, partial [Alphaproteobacteria bacterium]
MGRIVWIASFPKSGNTWVRVFLNNLFANADAPVALDAIGRFTTSEAAVDYYRRFDPRPPAAWTRQDTARMRPQVHALIAGLKDGLSLVKTHCRFGHDHGQPTVNLDVTAGAVYIVRNPLDVAVSFADHMGMTIDQAISIMAFPDAFTDQGAATVSEPRGSCSGNVASWTRPARPS